MMPSKYLYKHREIRRSAMDSSLEHVDLDHIEHLAHLMHDIPPQARVGRVRGAVLMLIFADALSVIAIMAAGGYLSALNVLGQFKTSGVQAPAFLPGLLLAIVFA